MGQIIAMGFKSYSIIFLILILLFLPFTIVIPKAESLNITSVPIIIDSSVNPIKAQPGDLMTVSASVLDFRGVEKVQAKFFHEKGFELVNLSRVSGSTFCGVWQGQWIVHDTKVKEYTTLVTVFSHSGLSASVSLTWCDPASWWDIDWGYRKLITFSHSRVPSDQTNFPVVLNITDTDLKDKAQPDGDDIAFTDVSGNKLNHEIEKYTSGTGALVAWVNVTSLSSSSDTEIYMYYGNSGCSNQENAAGVWAHYTMVYHLNEPAGTTGAGSVSDSTGHTSGTPSAGISFGQSGKIGTTADFSSGTGIGCGTLGSSLLTAETTVSFWIYSNNVASPARQNPFNQAYGGWGTMTLETTGVISWFFGSNGGDNSPYGSQPSSASTVTAGSWIYITSVRNPSGYTYSWYKNGDYLTGSTYPATYPVIADHTFTIGDGYVSPINGKLDEFRVSTVARSANWIKTSYNNQNNAYDGGFFTVDDEEIAIPTQPTLTTPTNNGYTTDTTPTFQWTSGENHENNTLYVSNESDFSEEHINISLSPSTSSYTTPGGDDLSDGRWYWKVVANNSQGSNSSDVWSFIVDTTPPLSVNLSSPANGSVSDSSSVTFSWDSTIDNTTNTPQVSDVAYYNLQVDNNQDFSSPSVDENTLDNITLSLTKTVTGQLYWRIRAWDHAGNLGDWSATRTLIIFSYSLAADSSTIQIKRGTTGSATLSITHIFGDVENVSLSSQWSGDNQPSSITVSFSTQEAPVSFDSAVIFTCGESASTGTFTCTINASSVSGINRSVNIDITVYSMLFSLDVFPRSLSLIRSDQDTATISVNFDQGALSTVTLTGTWIGSAPSGVSTAFSPSSGTPNFDSTITLTTSSSATAGSFVYRVTGTSSGLSKTANIYLDISKNMSLTVTTDKQTYQKGQSIEISGTVKDPDGNSVSSGTTTINLSAENWSHTFTTSITNGVYSTSYFITFDKPDGDWDISVTATDTKGHATSTPQTTSISVEIPEIYEQYFINVLSPTAGQVFKRGDTVTFTISLVNKDNERVQGAEVKACLASGETIVFSEGSPGIYSSSYDLGYDFTLGNLNIYVEGKKYEDEKLRVGFNTIDFKVSAVEPTLKLVELKPGDLVEVGEPVIIKIEALYPNGDSVENSRITSTGPNGTELVFSKSKSERGMYIASYIPTEEDIGNWNIKVIGEDAYGNSKVENLTSVEIVHTKIMSYLLRYWWATTLGSIMLVSFASYFANRKRGKIKLRGLKDEILELNKLKEKNAIFYFLDNEISREAYDQLSQEYESKIAHLSKKQRMLERKFENKKIRNKGKKNEAKKKP